MKPSALVAAILVLANVSPPPLGAHLPPPGPPQYAAYGPLNLCWGDYWIAVQHDEALHISGDIVRIIGLDHILAIKYTGFGTDRFDFGKTLSLMSGSKSGYIARFSFATPDPDRTLAYAPDGLGNDDIRYAILMPDQDRPIAIIGSDAFDGTEKDDRLLRRILLTSKVKLMDCIDLQRALGDRQYPAAVEKQRFLADTYPPQPESGPVYHCIGGIGFALKPGETLRRPWKPLRREGPVFIETEGQSIKIEGSDWRAQKVDPQSPHEHPLGLLQKSGITFYPSRGIGPPYAPEGVREPGSWSVKLGSDRPRGIEISFSASEGTAAGFRFLERLEFVEPEDLRCSRTRN